MRHRNTHRMCEACWFHDNCTEPVPESRSQAIGVVMPRFWPGTHELRTCCFCGDPTVAEVVINVKLVPAGPPNRLFCARNDESVMLV